MLIDFSPVENGDVKMLEFSKQFSLTELKAATNDSIDTILEIIQDMSDAQMTFLPFDPDADDPHAVEGEEKIGWSLAHLVVHVTATSEEGAAFSSILARGIPYPKEPRLRYETNWHTVTTRAQALQRLEESRRIRLAYLDTWPDSPQLDVYREMSEKALEKFGHLNAPATFLNSLKHEWGHFAQFREVRRQAIKAFAPASTK
ncbi:MAG: DinB family protein [Chloroflexota bacterium]